MIHNLTPLGQPGALSASATIHVQSGAAVGSGCGQASVPGTRTTGSPVITFSGVNSTVDLFVGQAVSGTGIPVDAVIASIDSHTQITLSDNATSDGTSTYTFAARALDASSRFTSTSSGIYAIDGPVHGYDLDLAALGNGEMFVGTVSGGTYSGRFSPGKGDAYRVGGGAGGAPLAGSGSGALPVPADDALAGDTASLIVGPGDAAGGAYRGIAVIAGNNSFGGGTVVNSGAALMIGRTGGTPFGRGRVVVQAGGILGAAGANGTFHDGTAQYAGYALLPGAALLLSEQRGGYTGDNGGQGRWGDAEPMCLADNILCFHGGKNNTAQETAGELVFAGLTRLRTVSGGGTSRYMLTVDSLRREEGGVLISEANLGGDWRLRAAGGNEPAVTNGIVAPWLLDGTGNDFLTYDSGSDVNGVFGLKAFTAYAPLASAGATNVASGSGDTLAGDVHVHALKLTGSLKGSGKTVTLGGGGLIITARETMIEPGFDCGDAEGVFHVTRDAVVLAGAVVAPRGLTKCGGGDVTLSGANDIAGRVTVAQGTLKLGGAAAAADWADCVLSVSKFGTANLNGQATSVAGLAGAGTVANGTLTVTQTFAPGGSRYPGRMNTAGLVLGAGCTTTLEIGAISDEVAVAGDLTLDGTLDVVAADGFAPGTYTIMTCSGTLTDNGMTIGARPGNASVRLDTSAPGEVRLHVVGTLPRTVIFMR